MSQNADYEPGTRVHWTATEHNGSETLIRGTVEGQGPHGRLIVRGDDGTENHIQPTMVQIDSSETDK